MLDFENLDFYEILGVSRSASAAEIKRAYRQEISKYHPDRFINAAPADQEYASRRSQRITEAYTVLSDFAARSAYNRGENPRPARYSPARHAVQPSAQPHARDHQAELYEQAQEHLAAGRTIQAIGVLQQLQKLNPFYRDSAALLAAAERQAQAHEQGGGRGRMRPLVIAGGAIGGVAVAALLVWMLNGRGVANVTGSSARATDAVAIAATEMPTALPEPTLAATGSTAPSLAATDVPTAAPPAPTDAPIVLPSPTVVPATLVPATPEQPSPVTVQEQGQLLFADAFATSGWATLGGNGWHVGYERGRYHITVDPSIGTIWSYRTGPARDASIGVDVQALSAEGGLLLRFLDENNYLSFSVNPQQTSFRLEQHKGGDVTLLTGGPSEAIHVGADAANRLTARLRGEQIELLINGQSVAKLDVSGAPNSSRYGLLAISGDTAAEAYFDNLEIRALE